MKKIIIINLMFLILTVSCFANSQTINIDEYNIRYSDGIFNESGPNPSFFFNKKIN